MQLGLFAPAATALLVACDDSVTDPPPPVPASVEASPSSIELTEIGATVQLSATVLAATGAEIEGAVVSWSTSDVEVASVNVDGVVEATGEGVATITATSGGVSSSAEVTVEL